MDTALLNHRIRLLMILTGLALSVIVVRLWIVQLTQWTDYAKVAAKNRTKIVWEPAPRGLVKDREGRVLISNRSRWDVEVVPAEFPRKQTAVVEHEIRLLAQILGVSTPQVRTSLAESLRQSALESVTLKDIGEDVSFKVVAQIEVRRGLELPGIRIGSHVERFYPQHYLAAHLLGYARAITADQYDDRKHLVYPMTDPTQAPPPLIADKVYDPSSEMGQSGVEKLFEDYQVGYQVLPLLQGRRGYQLYEVNAGGDPTGPSISQRAPVPGATVFLTIDGQLQKVAEEALDQTIARTGKAGAAVLVDVHTGEVLVLASRPAYDANMWVERFSPLQWNKLSQDPRHPLLNHAIGGSWAPGSIFKMISSSAAFGTTKLTTGDHYYCSGAIYQGRDHTRFGCWEPKGHGSVAYLQAMAESCDVYFYNLVLSQGLTSDNLAAYSRAFGLGSLTGIGLPGEVAGFVHDSHWKQDRLQEAWYTGDSLHMVIGQTFLAVTPLQMAMVTAAVANGGSLLQPQLVSKISWPTWLGYGTQVFSSPQGHKIGVDDSILAEVRRGMRAAVEGDHGTAKVMQGLGVPVAGKTGSAEDRPGRPTHAWFVCYAPADNPRYAACVFVEEGGHGGGTAAPIARKMLAAAFGVSTGAGVGPSNSD